VNKYQNKVVLAFTVSSPTFKGELVSPIWVSEFVELQQIKKDQVDEIMQTHGYRCVWDTGAMSTIITPKVVQELGLLPSSKKQYQCVGAAGQPDAVYEAHTYLVNLYLPHKVIIYGASVGELEPGGCDVLLGMDIIVQGDLAISNFNGETAFSFRTPSIEKTDYVQEIESFKSQNLKKQHSYSDRQKTQNKRRQSKKDRRSR